MDENQAKQHAFLLMSMNTKLADAALFAVHFGMGSDEFKRMAFETYEMCAKNYEKTFIMKQAMNIGVRK